MIDLQQFCANKWEPRAWMHAPFQLGACVYYTNGHMIVRVPRDEAPDVVVSESAPANVEALFNAAFDQEGEFAALPDPKWLPNDRLCSECNGAGHVDYGGGHERCMCCHGSGHYAPLHAIGDAHFNVHYLHLMAALPRASIRTHGPKGAAAIQFDGGQALLMPARNT